MKDVQYNTIKWLLYIALALLGFIAGALTTIAQTVTFSQPTYGQQTVSVPVHIDGVQGIGAISMKVEYDTNYFQYLYCEPDPELFIIGNCFSSCTNTVNFGWFSNTVSVYNGEIPVTLVFRPIGGCDSLTFAQCQGCCELADIVGNPIMCEWGNSQLCDQFTGIERVEVSKVLKLKRYNLLGQKVK